MAKVQSRARSDGGVSYRVMWVVGGGRARSGAAVGEVGSQASETFTDEKLMFLARCAAAPDRVGRGWMLVPAARRSICTTIESGRMFRRRVRGAAD